MGVELEFEVGNGGWVSYLSCALEKMKVREHAGKRRGRTRELTGGGDDKGQWPRYFWLARATGSRAR